jgi:molecular chaperone DnaK
MRVPIGIDLGTTNCCVAHIKEDGNIEVIINSEGNRTTPSVFTTVEGEVLVGDSAIEQEAFAPKNVIRSIKRYMGTNKRFTIEGKVWSPEEISAEILKKLKKDAENFLNQEVTDVIITVPAYFDNNQRKATMVAGELAGLKVLRVINEPTAASLAYGLGKNKNEKILVYDLGGGTFDVTILSITDDGVFEVKSTAGDTALGGDDIDKLIINTFIQKINKDMPDLDCSDVVVQSRLREAAEKMKKQLSFNQSYEVKIPYFFGSQTFQFKMFRAEFNTMIKPLIDKTLLCIKQALNDASMDYKDLNQIVLVGGSTRIPCIAEMLSSLTGITPHKGVNPDEAVGIGATIQVATLTGNRERDIFLVDVTPLSLGVEVYGELMSIMIRRNTTIPCEYTERFTTYEDEQSSVEVKVFQGERPNVKDNRKLDEFRLSIIPAPRGVAKIDVTFKIDVNGILSVKALDAITGTEVEAVISGGSSLTPEEIQSILLNAELNKEQDELERTIKNGQAVLFSQIIQVESFLRNNMIALAKETVKYLKDILDSLNDAKDSKNIEILGELAKEAGETIQKASDEVYVWAETKLEKVK